MAIERLLAQVETELARAEGSRSAGNEAQARVSARRAAGILIREHLNNQGVDVEGMSAYDSILLLLSDQEIPAQVREILEHLALRVSPDGNLPAGVDLVADVRQLRNHLQIG
jgi:HEPN domain-containing protein